MLQGAEYIYIRMTEEIKDIKKAILCGASKNKDADFESSMEELKGLSIACGYECAGMVTQRLDHFDNATYIGPGKLFEIKELLEETGADTVIFLNTLTPSQLSNLADGLSASVLDKTALILEIFGERARSAEAKLQVEYARLGYMLPRLRGLRKDLSRQGGAGGSMSNKGSGEKQIELDRRVIEKRMSELRKRLEQLEGAKRTKRRRRENSGLPLISLAGYTNAGKSTLLNKLVELYGADEEKRVEEKDMLFVTLDTSTRRISPKGHRDFLLSDTVGFINGLPHELIKAFRSTLSEIADSDLILQVVDCSDEEHLKHIQVTEDTLRELSASGIPMIYVMNKADKVYERHELPKINGDHIFISAKEGIGIEELCGLIGEKLREDMLSLELEIPYSDFSAEHFINTHAEVLKKEYTGSSIEISCLIGRRYIKRIKEYIKLTP